MINYADIYSGISINVSDSWKVITRDNINSDVSPNASFIITTDRGNQIYIVCASRCMPNEFFDMYKSSINNMKYTGIDILYESEELLKLQTSEKTFKQVVYEYNVGGNKTRIVQLSSLLNGFYISFSIDLDSNLKFDMEFSKSNSYFDLIKVIESVKEY